MSVGHSCCRVTPTSEGRQVRRDGVGARSHVGRRPIPITPGGPGARAPAKASPRRVVDHARLGGPRCLPQRSAPRLLVLAHPPAVGTRSADSSSAMKRPYPSAFSIEQVAAKVLPSVVTLAIPSTATARGWDLVSFSPQTG